MKKYIKNKKQSNIMKYFNLIIIMILCIWSSYALESNITSLGGEQVSDNNALFIDFSNESTMILFSVIFILLILSFLVIIHPINSLLLLFLSVILMANGFNLLLSFIVMLISISFIAISSK